MVKQIFCLGLFISAQSSQEDKIHLYETVMSHCLAIIDMMISGVRGGVVLGCTWLNWVTLGAI